MDARRTKEELLTKLFEFGYDLEKRVVGTPTDVYNIARGHLNGLVLFSGRVVAESGFTALLEDNYLYVTNAKVGKENSLYISPLWKRIQEEYIQMRGIQLNDRIWTEDKVIGSIDSFALMIQDARGRFVARIEFYKRGGMLYVPKKEKAAASKTPLDTPLDDPLDKDTISS